MIERIDRQRGDVSEVGLSEELLKVNLKDWKKRWLQRTLHPFWPLWVSEELLAWKSRSSG